MEKINERVKEIRKKAGYTQEQMGAVLNMKRSTYAHLESFGRFKFADLLEIASHFKEPVESLFEGFEYMLEPSSTRLREKTKSPFTVDPLNESVISANERQLIKFYRNSSSENKKLILNLAKELGTKE